MGGRGQDPQGLSPPLGKPRVLTESTPHEPLHPPAAPPPPPTFTWLHFQQSPGHSELPSPAEAGGEGPLLPGREAGLPGLDWAGRGRGWGALTTQRPPGTIQVGIP